MLHAWEGTHEDTILSIPLNAAGQAAVAAHRQLLVDLETYTDCTAETTYSHRTSLRFRFST